MDLLAHLEAYVAIVDEGSFSGAAEFLGIAQPVLSRRIKTLEQHFGGDLFDRSRRRITTTELGVLLFPHARDVLNRVDHLGQVARSALVSTTYALGVPLDCDPVSLAHVIRAGTERGVAIGVHELPAEERATGLADGSLAFALLRVPPEAATHEVPLGLAAAHTLAGSSGRPVHLEDLRPRRGAGVTPPPSILVTAEDGIGFAAERFRKAAARAGLPEGRVRDVALTATAVAETLAGHAVLVCAEPFARRHDLGWSPLAEAGLHRGYEFATTSRRTGHGVSELDWLEPLLVQAIGANGGPAQESIVEEKSADPDPRARLAARG